MPYRPAFAWLAGPLLLAGCSSGTPCSGSNCLPVGGSYLFTLNPPIRCPAWEQFPTSSSPMVVSQLGSQITLTLWPTTGTPVHTLTGTLNSDGSIQTSESQLNSEIGIPFATIGGVFQSQSTTKGQAPFYFSGSLVLQGTGAAPATSGGGATSGGLPTGASQGLGGGSTQTTGCTGSSTMTAVEQGFSSIAPASTGDAGMSSADGGTA